MILTAFIAALWLISAWLFSDAVDERLGVLEKEAHEATERLRRLYKLVEDGVAEMDDILKTGSQP